MSNVSSPRYLMSLGMFIFGMGTANYHQLFRTREWHHETTERHGARPAAQFIGPGPESIQLTGLLVPELGADAGSLETLAEMAATGDTYPLIDGAGRVLGHYRIARLEEDHLSIMAGGTPRHVGFRIELARGDDQVAQGTAQ